jgi:alkanesulfonate monooxygenase SsuD/methylene tetrahydromethanopterin reductase-like flavin-dependent oxidoreductase (luciferase family)
MRCSINIPNLGDFADPRVVAEAARLAEQAGWDGLFIWDHLIGYNRGPGGRIRRHEHSVGRGGAGHKAQLRLVVALRCLRTLACLVG